MKFNKVYIEITNRCNLACSFCMKSKQEKRDMSVHEFKSILHEIKQVTSNIYLHVKGEPLLHPDLDELLQICDEYGMRVNITTNGTLIEQRRDMLLKHACVKKINFSLHCENNDVNYLYHVFKCSEILSKQMTIVYRLWTLNDHTLDDKSMQIVNAMKEYYHLDKTTLDNILQKQNTKVVEHIYIDKDNEFVWPSLDNKVLNEDGYCYALKTHIAVLVNGDVVPCCLDGEGVIQLGNLHKQSMDSIIHSTRFVNLKKSFQDRKPCEKLCKRCGFKIRINK